jgi:hypothetical protein
MKIIIEKEFDRLGDEWLRQKEVVAELYTHNDDFIISMDDDDVRYSIPVIAVKAVIEFKKDNLNG